MTDTLHVASAAWEAALEHAREAAPEECCGLLIGSGTQVFQAVRARNAAADRRRRFTVDPADHFDAIRRARGAGLAVIGAYHSHPDGPPQPSESDRAEAFEDDQFVHVIVSPRPEQIGAYRLVAGNFVALSLVKVQ